MLKRSDIKGWERQSITTASIVPPRQVQTHHGDRSMLSPDRDYKNGHYSSHYDASAMSTQKGSPARLKSQRGSTSVASREEQQRIKDQKTDSAVFVESLTPGSVGALDSTTQGASISRGAHQSRFFSHTRRPAHNYVTSTISSYAAMDTPSYMTRRRASRHQ